MSLESELEDAEHEIILGLLDEVADINLEIDIIDDMRNTLLRSIAELNVHYENALKKLQNMGYDTSNL